MAAATVRAAGSSKRDITMDKIENRTAFDKLKQDKTKDPLAVQKFLLKLQEIQRKLGKDLATSLASVTNREHLSVLK